MPLPAVIEALDKVGASHHEFYAETEAGLFVLVNCDRLMFAADTWQIVAVDPIYSGDSVVAYRLQLRT
jgi:hypothetical protein